MATLASTARVELDGVGAPQGVEPAKKAPGKSNGLVDAVEQVAGMLILAWQAMVATFTPPFSWKDDLVEETWLIIHRCFFPVFLATTFWGFGSPGLTGANIVNTLGTVDRMGALFVMVSVRVGGPWLDGMVVAGVAGTAICADLGARKVREEIDALSVLGIDPVRSLVVPRVLALGFVTALMNFVAIVACILGGWLAAVVVFGETSAGFVSTFSSNFALPDLVASVVKTSLFGFIIAIVCCYTGLNVKGGAEGVGRAVNQAVVTAFVGIWVFNSVFTFTLLAAFPELGNLH
jgi:phospholipid/cholesterol/gamma-HCH transport system permease protein